MKKRTVVTTSGWSIGSGTVLFLLLTLPAMLQAQQKEVWNISPIAYNLFGNPISDSAFPTLLFGPWNRLYISFALPSRSTFYYTYDQEEERGTFQDFSPVPKSQAESGLPFGQLNLLAVDSGTTLHFLGLLGSDPPCLRHTTNTLQKNLLTPFEPLDPAEPDQCNVDAGGHAAMEIDAKGNLHLLYVKGESIFYQVRSVQNGWDAPILLSDSLYPSDFPALALLADGTIHAAFLSRIDPTDPKAGWRIVYRMGDPLGFAEPELLDTLSETGIDQPIELIADSQTILHLAWVTTDSPAFPFGTIGYRERKDGRWGESVDVIRDHDRPAGPIGLTVDRFGATHLCVVTREGEREGMLYHTSNAAGSWEALQPMLSVPGIATPVLPPLHYSGGDFSGLRDSLLVAALPLRRTPDGSQTYPALISEVINFHPAIELSVDTIDLGRRKAGTIDTLVRLANRGKQKYESLSIAPVTFHPLVGELPSIAISSTFPDVVGGDSIDVPIGLTFTQQGPFAFRILFTTNGGIDTLLVRGRVLAEIDTTTTEEPDVSAHRISLDTVAVNVGETGWLHCRVDPPLSEKDSLSLLTLRLTYNPDGLFPDELLLPGDSAEGGKTYHLLQSVPVRPGIIDVTIMARTGRSIVGGELFQIGFEGLLTAELRNRVTIAIDTDRSSANVAPIGRDAGMVIVNGCEIGSDLGLARGGFAERPMPNPVRDYLTVRSIAPAGTPVSLAIINAEGGEIEVIDLKDGNGMVSEEQINLQILPAGFYILQLRIGPSRFTTTIIRE